MPTAVLVEQYQSQEQKPQCPNLTNNESLIAEISLCVGQVENHLTCPICLDNITDAHFEPSSANLHRFSGNCIKQSFGIGGLDKKFREDKQFDELVSAPMIVQRMTAHVRILSYGPTVCIMILLMCLYVSFLTISRISHDYNLYTNIEKCHLQYNSNSWQ